MRPTPLMRLVAAAVRLAAAAVRLAAALAVVGLAVAAPLAGCGPATVTVDLHAGQAVLAKGQTLRVDLGRLNESVGDSWYLTGPPEAAVLREKGRDYRSDCAGPAAGCGGRLAWEFTGAGPGTTTVAFRYCYRSRPPSCQPGPGPAEPLALTVTVR